MAHSVVHAFVSAKADGGDTSIVRPSDWNAGHSITVDLAYTAGLTGTLANAQLANSTITIGTTSVALGASSTSFGGITSIGAAATGTPTLFGDVTTGSITIGAGLTTGALNLATSGTGITSINIGHTNSIITIVGAVTATSFSGPLTGTSSKATNIVGAAWGVPYQSATDTTSFVVAAAAGMIFASNGTTSAPSWKTPTQAGVEASGNAIAMAIALG